MEKLIIKNFLAIKQIEIEIKPFTVIIGPQASGKSVISKSLYFMKSIHSLLLNEIFENTVAISINKKIKSKFYEYFPGETKLSKGFLIKYINGKVVIEFSSDEHGALKINYIKELYELYRKERKEYANRSKEFTAKDLFSDDYKLKNFIKNEFYKYYAEKLESSYGYFQIYIPAGRSFFSNLQNSVFSFLSSNNAIDPFLRDFGQIFENIKTLADRFLNKDKENDDVKKKVKKQISEILKGEYVYEKSKVYINNEIGKLNISNCSSGQQEILPLLLMIGTLPFVRFSGNGGSIYIEEPEAHLFPSSQKVFIDLLVTCFNNSRDKVGFFITTHSPYILSSINLCIQIGEYIKRNAESQEDKNLSLDFDMIKAYSLKNGEVKSITNDEYKVIETKSIDEISDYLIEKYACLNN